MPGSTPATSQLDWLISITAMIVLFWSRATRDLFKSFGWGIAALHRFHAATKLPFPRRPPHSFSRSPSTVSSVHSGACDATHAAIVKPGTPDRSRRRARRAICGTPGDGQSRARDRLGDFEHLAASLFAFSARFEICRDDRIVGRGKGPNSGRERDSLIRAKLSLIARFNSL